MPFATQRQAKSCVWQKTRPDPAPLRALAFTRAESNQRESTPDIRVRCTQRPSRPSRLAASCGVWTLPALKSLKPADATRHEQESETNDPRPRCNRFRNIDHSKIRSERDEEKDQRDYPHCHRWSFTRIAHDVFLHCGSGEIESILDALLTTCHLRPSND